VSSLSGISIARPF